MHDYLILFFLLSLVILSITEFILSIRRGNRGLTGDIREGHSFLEPEYRPMWLCIAALACILTIAYMVSE